MSKISTKAQEIINAVRGCKGQFVHVEYVTIVKPAAAHKDKVIKKFVRGVFRTGIDYANLKTVREAVESGERGEVKSLPWGEWLEFPWIIGHKDNEYVRLYPVKDVQCATAYLVEVEGVPVPQPPGVTTKEWIASYLTKSDAANLLSEGREHIDCITKKVSDVSVLGCWNSSEGIENELKRWNA